jgi:replicative DNA helicase
MTNLTIAPPPPKTKYTNGKNGHHNGNGQHRPKPQPDTLQPHNIEAEEGVLGSLLIDNDAIIRIVSTLKPGDFFIGRHGWIYEAITDLFERRRPCDIITLTDELERRGYLKDIGGPAYLTDLINLTPTSVHVEHYAKIVERTATLRRLIDGVTQIAQLAYEDKKDADEVMDEAESIIFRISEKRSKRDLTPLRASIESYYDMVEYRSNHPSQLVGVPTGLRELDKLLGGLQKTDLVVMAGRPGMGKTSLALSTALHAARKHDKRVSIFSLEMSDEQLVQRLLSAETGIDSQRLRLGQIREEEWPVFIQATETLANTPIFLDDTPAISVMELRTKARHQAATDGLDLLIVDYLQLMRGDSRSENRQQEISFISRSLKELAKELNIPVLALSQLSRACESRHDKRPMLSDLRESGAIEQDADAVMFVYRDEMYNQDTEFPNVAEIIVSKHRHGPTGMFSVYFKKTLAQFVDLEVRTQPLEY